MKPEYKPMLYTDERAEAEALERDEERNLPVFVEHPFELNVMCPQPADDKWRVFDSVKLKI